MCFSGSSLHLGSCRPVKSAYALLQEISCCIMWPSLPCIKEDPYQQLQHAVQLPDAELHRYSPRPTAFFIIDGHRFIRHVTKPIILNSVQKAGSTDAIGHSTTLLILLK